MNPLQLRRAGAIIDNCLQDGYSEEDAETICRALFLPDSEGDMKAAWRLFAPMFATNDTSSDLEDAKESGFLDQAAFRRVIPLIAEDWPSRDVDMLFLEADLDGSGLIEYTEFVTLIAVLGAEFEEI